MKHLSEQLPNPQDIVEDLPDGVAHVIQKMMAKDRADRYQNCDQLIQDLRAILRRGFLIAPPREKAPGVKPAVKPAAAAAPAPVARPAALQKARPRFMSYLETMRKPRDRAQALSFRISALSMVRPLFF
jgi:hypothetical protein